MKIQNFDNERDWIKAITNFVTAENPQTIALSGGSTPIPLYRELKNSITGDEIFYQVDERYVPKDHPDSNYKIIKETLQKPCRHFDTSLPITQALKKYTGELQKLPGWPEKTFDLCILGIGPDGHTASLFPDTPNTDEPVAHTTTDNFTVKDRLTITFPTILKSKTILILLKNKPEIIADLQNPTKTPEEFPALQLLSHHNLHIFNLKQ